MTNRGHDGGAHTEARTGTHTEAELERIWTAALEQAERELGTNRVAQWIRPVRLTSIVDDLAVLSASTSFLADWVERNYGLHLLRILRSLSPGVRRITLAVSAAAPAPDGGKDGGPDGGKEARAAASGDNGTNTAVAGRGPRAGNATAAGRGPGGALGIIAVLIVGIATYVSHRVIANIEKKRTAGGGVVAEGTGAAI